VDLDRTAAGDELSDAEFDRLVELLADIPSEGAQTVYLSGSRAEGWASVGSNYNFYVIGSPPPGLRPESGFATPPDNRRVQTHHAAEGEDRFVVHYWRPEDVAWLTSAVRTHELRPTVEIWLTGIQFLHRLLIGVPLLGRDAFEAARDAVDADLLSRYLAQNASMYAESYRTDAVTRMSAGRLDDALLQVQLCVESQVDAYLAARGETNAQEKWRSKRVARQSDPALSRDYRRFTLGAGPEADDVAVTGYIVRCLHFAETLNCCVQLACRYEQLTPAEAGAVGGIPGGTAAEEPVTRDLASRLCRRHDGRAFVVLPSGRAADLSPVAALVYGCADGRTGLTGITEHVEAVLTRGRPAGDDVREVVTALRDRGFVHTERAGVA
jgi:hypothetical protein